MTCRVTCADSLVLCHHSAHLIVILGLPYSADRVHASNRHSDRASSIRGRDFCRDQNHDVPFGRCASPQALLPFATQGRNRRHNRAFIRQGEWFFIPQPDLVVDSKLVLQGEPLARGRGKPHMAEFAYRTGGETVYVSSDCPQGVTEAEYKALLTRKPSAKRLQWRTMRRNAAVYVCGKVRHPDHKTVKLSGWHQVLPNTESQAASMRHLTFLD